MINNELEKGLTAEQAVEQAKRCLGCKTPACVAACPIKQSIPQFIKCIQQGDFIKAKSIVESDSIMPSVCSRVCPQHLQCQGACVRNKIDGCVEIGKLERFAADYNGQTQTDVAHKSAKKVAVIGGGASGMACAYRLAKKGINAEIFEADQNLGGIVYYGMPHHRMPKPIINKYADKLANIGVKINCSAYVDQTKFDMLLSNYDAVFVGIGATKQVSAGLDENKYIMPSDKFLRLNIQNKFEWNSSNGSVIIIGCGNAAMDAAQVAALAGADTTVVYRRSVNEMPAHMYEYEQSVKLGVKFKFLTSQKSVVLTDGKLSGLVCVSNQLIDQSDADGRQRVKQIENSEFEIKCNLIVTALGAKVDAYFKDLQTNADGTIKVNAKGQTSLSKVFAGGDAVSGSKTVVAALNSGAVAADGIIEFLQK